MSKPAENSLTAPVLFRNIANSPLEKQFLPAHRGNPIPSRQAAILLFIPQDRSRCRHASSTRV